MQDGLYELREGGGLMRDPKHPWAAWLRPTSDIA